MFGQSATRDLEQGGCMPLTTPENEALFQLFSKAQRDIDRLGQYCKELEEVVADRPFLFLYAAILLANKGRLGEAITLLGKYPQDRFGEMLHAYLAEKNSFTPPAVVFADSHPFDVFTHTEFYSRHLSATVDARADFALKFPPPGSSRHFSILDIGPGNGLLICQIINRLSTQTKAESCHLILVDQSEPMLEAATQYCTNTANIPLTTTHIESRIQDIAHGCLKEFLDSQQVWFVNAGLSLHHMPDREKIQVLRQLKDVSEHCLITELNANHDRTEKDTPEFVYSVVKTFGYLIEAVLQSSVSDQDKRACTCDYLLSEAIKMLHSDREHRLDFHATIFDWSEYAEKAGYEVVSITPSISLGGRPLLFTMHMRA